MVAVVTMFLVNTYICSNIPIESQNIETLILIFILFIAIDDSRYGFLSLKEIFMGIFYGFRDNQDWLWYTMRRVILVVFGRIKVYFIQTIP